MKIDREMIAEESNIIEEKNDGIYIEMKRKWRSSDIMSRNVF